MKQSATETTVSTPPRGYEGRLSASDVFTAGKLLCCAVAALAPQGSWPAVSRWLARLQLKLRGSNSGRIAHACRRYVDLDPNELELQVTAAGFEENIEAIREMLPGGWRRRIAVQGSESIDKARRDGRGAVLWVSFFAHSDLVTKRGLAMAGYRPSHLSHLGHPFSPTWVGARLLNPVRLRVEDRYLERRVLVSYGNAAPALDALRRVLRENGVVTVTAIGAGRKAAILPLLGGTLRLALGAPKLALETGAALIPVYTVRDADGGYTVHCGADLCREGGGSGSEAMERMAEGYTTLLESFVRAHPGEWRGWFSNSWQPPKA